MDSTDYCTVKNVIDFPVLSRDVTNQTLPGRKLLNYSLLERVWLVTSRLETGKSLTFFYSVMKKNLYSYPAVLLAVEYLGRKNVALALLLLPVRAHEVPLTLHACQRHRNDDI